MGTKKIIIIVSSFIVISLIGFLTVTSLSHPRDDTYTEAGNASAASTNSSNSDTPGDNPGGYTYIPPVLQNGIDGNGATGIPNSGDPKSPTEIPFVPSTELDTDPKSITVLVNKEYSLPKDYIPENMVMPNVAFDLQSYGERKLMRPEAAKALEELFAAAENDGIYLCGVSGYRSFDRQYKIFIDNIVARGKKHTLRYSAVPGASEHQTGLSIDVSSKSFDYKLITTFASTPEGLWLAANSYRFGFVIRYPKDKTSITVYAYEPWHIRYLGMGLSNYLYTNKLTLDEYYNYTPSKDFDFEALYAELINYKPTPTPTVPAMISIIPVPTEAIPTETVGEDGDSDGVSDDPLGDDPVIVTGVPSDDGTIIGDTPEEIPVDPGDVENPPKNDNPATVTPAYNSPTPSPEATDTTGSSNPTNDNNEIQNFTN